MSGAGQHAPSSAAPPVPPRLRGVSGSLTKASADKDAAVCCSPPCITFSLRQQNPVHDIESCESGEHESKQSQSSTSVLPKTVEEEYKRLRKKLWVSEEGEDSFDKLGKEKSNKEKPIEDVATRQKKAQEFRNLWQKKHMVAKSKRGKQAIPTCKVSGYVVNCTMTTCFCILWFIIYLIFAFQCYPLKVLE